MKNFHYQKPGVLNQEQLKLVLIIVEVNGFFMVSFLFLFIRYNKSLYIYISGDRKHLNDAKKHVQDFYRDLIITIDDIPQKPVIII